jgi:hypothetical protein
MLTKTYAVTKAQQKKLKTQVKWGSSLALMVWKGYLAKFHRGMARFVGSFQALQQEDSSFKGESTLPKAQDFRLMGLD